MYSKFSYIFKKKEQGKGMKQFERKAKKSINVTMSCAEEKARWAKENIAMS